MTERLGMPAGPAVLAVGVTLVAVALGAVAGCRPDGTPVSSGLREPVRPPSAAAPAPTPPDAPPAKPCRVADLEIQVRAEGDGATGHRATLVDFHNVGGTSCLLSGYPRRVRLSAPGLPTVIAERGGFFDHLPLGDRPVAPGRVATVVIQTDATCEARPGGGPSGPEYHRVSVALREGVLTATTPRHAGLDVGCGAFVTRFGRWR